MRTHSEPGAATSGALKSGGRATSPAREYAFTLVLGAAGAAVVLLATRQGWDRVVTGGPAPLPTARVPVSGESLVPLGGALALASLAGLAAVIATRRGVRRAVGLLLVVFGVAMAVALTLPVAPGDIRAAAVAAGSVQGGSATSGAASGAVPAGLSGTALAGHAGYIAATGSLWRPLAVAGALVVVAAGMLVAWRGMEWATMSSRYDRAGASPETPRTATADMWESLTKGIDPTEQDGVRTRGAGPGTPGTSRE